MAEDLVKRLDARIGKSRTVTVSPGLYEDIRDAKATIEQQAASLAAKDKEIERLRCYLHPYADDTEISGMSWSGFYLIGNKKSIAELYRIENRSSQLEVFRAAFDERAKAAETRAEQAERALAEATRLRPTDDWHEDLGDVLWWRIGDDDTPLETPWVGSPLSCGYTVEAHTTTRIISQINQESDPEPTIERISVGGWVDDYFTHFSEIPRASVAQHGSDSREGK